MRKRLSGKASVTAEIPLTVESVGQKRNGKPFAHAANIIDDFSKLTVSEKAKAPVAQLSGTLLDFGKLPDKSSFIPLVGGRVSGTIEITNSGKSPLVIYSVTCEDERVAVSGGKREIKPGMTATFKVTVRPKEIKTKLETLINFVCNDPNGPVRLVKVTANK